MARYNLTQHVKSEIWIFVMVSFSIIFSHWGMQNMPLMYHQNRLQCFLFQISNAYNLSTEAQMFTRLQGFTTFYPSQILLQTCSCSKPRLICRKGSLKHISSQLFNLSRLFFLSSTHVTPFSWLKMIEAEGSQTFRWSLTKASKKSSKQPGRNCHSQQQLKPIYESKCSSEYSTLSDKV